MADKIDQIKLGSTSYDIDLPRDATPTIVGLTVDDNKSGSDLFKIIYDNSEGYFLSVYPGSSASSTVAYTFDVESNSVATNVEISFPAKTGIIALRSELPEIIDLRGSNS